MSGVQILHFVRERFDFYLLTFHNLKHIPAGNQNLLLKSCRPTHLFLIIHTKLWQTLERSRDEGHIEWLQKLLLNTAHLNSRQNVSRWNSLLLWRLSLVYPCANGFDSAYCRSAFFPHQGLKHCALPVGDKWCLKATIINFTKKWLEYNITQLASHPTICGFGCIFVVWLWGQSSLTLSVGAQGIPSPDRMIPPASLGPHWYCLSVGCAWKFSHSKHPGSILIIWLNHISWLLFKKKSSNFSPNISQIMVLLSFSLRLSPDPLCRMLIWKACIQNVVRLVTFHNSWP